MGLIRVIFELFMVYLVYKLIFDFIIPIYETTRQVKQKVGEMQYKMNEHMKQQQQQATQATAAPKEPATKPGKEDYIEFEEVK